MRAQRDVWLKERRSASVRCETLTEIDIGLECLVLDEIAHAIGAQSFAERLHRVADHFRGSARPHRCATRQTEERADLTEVVAGFRHREQLGTAGSQLAHDLEFATRDDVDQVTRAALSEQRVAGREFDALGRAIAHAHLRHEFDDAIGQRQHAMVVRRHDDDPRARTPTPARGAALLRLG